MILDISALFHGTLHEPGTWIHGGSIDEHDLLTALWTEKKENDKQRFCRLFVSIPKWYAFIVDFGQRP